MQELGDRLASEGRRLLLLVEHLSGRAVRARVEPEDLVQEVFLRALARPSDAPPPDPGEEGLRRWLNALARHVVIDVARALRAAKRDASEAPLARSAWSTAGLRESALPAGTPGPATRVAAAEGERGLARAYRSLAPDRRSPHYPAGRYQRGRFPVEAGRGQRGAESRQDRALRLEG